MANGIGQHSPHPAGTARLHSRLDERTDPRGSPYYWIGGDAQTGVPERGTDVGALAEGFVSVTPLQLDLTGYRTMNELNTWQWVDESNPYPAPQVMFSYQPLELKNKV